MKVADFGSGAGYLGIIIAKIIGDSGLLTALDIMESALDNVRARAKAEGLENIDTVRSNLEVLGGSGLRDESQNVVLLVNILFESNKKEDIIYESRRVLRPEGQLVVVDWKKGVYGFGPPDDLRIDPLSMRKMVESTGFEFVNNIDAGTFHQGIVFKKIKIGN